MRKIADIHVFEDEAFLARMRAMSAAVLVAGLLAAVLWALAMTVLREFFSAPVVPFELGAVLGSFGDRLMGAEVPDHGVDLRWWISLIVAIPATFAFHELVHAFFFKYYAPPGVRVTFGSDLGMGMIYASAEGVVYPRDAYLVIALAPSVVVTLLVAVLGIGIKWPLWTILVATAHLSGCTGDWGYVRAIRLDPTVTYCEDTAWGVALYGADERRRGGRARVSGASCPPSGLSASGMTSTSRRASSSGEFPVCRPAPAHGKISTREKSPASRRAQAHGESSGFSVVEGGKRP